MKQTKTKAQRNKMYRAAYCANANHRMREVWGMFICQELSRLKYGSSHEYTGGYGIDCLAKDFPEFALFQPGRRHSSLPWFRRCSDGLRGRENDWRLTVLAFCITLTGGLDAH